LQVSNGGIIESAFPVIGYMSQTPPPRLGFHPSEPKNACCVWRDPSDAAIRNHQFVGAKSDVDQALDFISAPARAHGIFLAAQSAAEDENHFDLSRGKQVHRSRAVRKRYGKGLGETLR
jgi:hypothetical protein